MSKKVKSRSNRITLLAFFGLLLIVACKLLPQGSSTPILNTTHTLSVTEEHISTKIPTLTSFPTALTTTTQLVDFVLSENVGEHVGEVITVRIQKAYCSYRPDVNGAPTFCNDQPFPNHTFTLIAWGRDWTDLDGKCVYIAGVVEEYEGKYEIIADSRDQVSLCD